MPQILNADEAILKIRPGSRLFIGSGAAVPAELVRALKRNSPHFRDNRVHHILTLGDDFYTTAETTKNLRSSSLFIGANARRAVQEGWGDFTPMFLSEIPRLFASPGFGLHAALVMVSPPDKHGMVSLGVSVDVVRSAVENSDIIVAQINEHMPRTFGQSFLRYEDLDFVVHHNEALPELPPVEPDEVNLSIGRLCAELIDDGAVMQMGIGAIPDAVLKSIGHKKNLGIHTEMFSDGAIDLIERGIITNQTKEVLKGRILTSFVMGSRRLYDFVHENPLVEFYPSDFTNDPFIISKNPNVVAINSALQVDLTGQVCADSIGHRFYSGIGGQVDFIRGASRSCGGKPVIALPSTAKGGKISRIVPELFAGAGVVTSRGDVHYVVTEYGIAHLYGKSIRERALELIQVAHPDFRSELLGFVKQTRYVYFDQKLLSQEARYPEHLRETLKLKQGNFTVRALKLTDEEALQSFFYSHAPETVRQRWLHSVQALPHEQAQELVLLDYRRRIALGVFQSDGIRERLLAVGRLHGQPGSDYAETAVVVSEGLRHQSVGLHLLRLLTQHAIQEGICELRCPITGDNVGAIRLIRKLCDDGLTLALESTDGELLARIALPYSGKSGLMEPSGENSNGKY